MPLDPLYPLPMAPQTALRGRRVQDPTRECPQVYDEARMIEMRRFNTTVIESRSLDHNFDLA
jgi:hypothetical protein